MSEGEAKPLRLYLRLNAGFSTASAGVCLIATGPLAELMGVPAWILRSVGVGLLAFAAQLVWTSGRRNLARLRSEALLDSLADLGWVAGTGVVLACGWLTPAGDRLLLGVGVPVSLLGLAQLRALCALGSADSPAS